MATITSVPNNPIFAQPAGTVQPQTAAAPAAAATKASSRRLPKLDNEGIGKLAAAGEYKKIDANGVDASGQQKFKSGSKLKVGGAKAQMEKNKQMIYVPAYRLTGEYNVIQAYLMALAQAGTLGAAPNVQAVLDGAYGYNNAVAIPNADLEAEIAQMANVKAAASSAVAASSSGSAPAVVKSTVTLQQLIDLNGAMGRTRAKGADGKTGDRGARKTKTVVEKLAEAIAYNQGVIQGQAYKYVVYSSTQKGVTWSLKAKSDKAVGLNAIQTPLAAKDGATLRVALNSQQGQLPSNVFNSANAQLAAMGF
jgi:hypothetical protein